MSAHEIRWSPGPHTVVLSYAGGPPSLLRVEIDESVLICPSSPLPLVELGVVGSGRSWSARRYIDSVAGQRLAYRHHAIEETATGERLVVTSEDESTGLRVTTTLSSVRGAGVVTFESRIVNDGNEDVDLSWVTSATWGGALAGSPIESLRLWWAENDWLAENRWFSAGARELLPDLTRSAHEHDPRGEFSRTALGAWSTDGSLPLGVLVDEATGTALGWQIEHNGAWHWQAGERTDGIYVSLLGPTEAKHDWYARLTPGQEFTTVPATLALSTGGYEGVVAELTAARRSARRPHPDHSALPVVFNDYMNTLMGDPTTDKLLPLIDAAAAVGAETFCVDAGWYDDDSVGWWDSVGAWEPATNRFPGGGLANVLERIRDRGMVAGLWLEPEVVGLRSPVADSLPDEAFFLRHGRRVVEHERYHLDLRHPLARKHLDEVVDRLVDMGVGYFKLDYNINIGTGTDHDAFSAGAGLLGHNRAYLDWVDGVLDRHPDLTLENCASGGLRVDYAMLSRLQMQSTSDQQDPFRYPPIAAAASAAIAPEQAASWSYPQPDFTDEEIAFTMSTGLLGRVHLSGHLDKMTDAQRDLVAEAVTAYRSQRAFIGEAVPFWPLGLPGWDDEWVAHGLRDDESALVTVWRRGGSSDSCTLRLPGWTAASPVHVVYPAATDGHAEIADEDGSAVVTVTLPHTHLALTLAIGERPLR